VTLETKHLIDFSDIIGVELECKKCKGKIMLSLGSAKPFWSCPLCNADWLAPETEEHQIIRQLFVTLATADKTMQGRQFTLRLQMALPSQVPNA
jgi:hypothetical protein